MEIKIVEILSNNNNKKQVWACVNNVVIRGLVVGGENTYKINFINPIKFVRTDDTIVQSWLVLANNEPAIYSEITKNDEKGFVLITKEVYQVIK